MSAFNRNGKNTGYRDPSEAGGPLTVQVGTYTDEVAPVQEPVGEIAPVPLSVPSAQAWNKELLREQVEHNNLSLRDRLLTRLEHMEPQRLASSLGAVLAKLGYRADGAPKTVDGELEFTGTLVVGGAITSRLAVHVRRQSGAPLGVDAVRALRGCLELEEQGLLVTTGDFSEAARAEAQAAGRRQISLMNGQQLAALMLEHEIGVEATTFKVYDVVLD